MIDISLPRRMERSRAGRARPRMTIVVVIAMAISATNAAAVQLRPLAPVNWRLVSGERRLSAAIGMGVLNGQQASLAGTRGNLEELGNFRIGLRSDRIALEVAGTLLRRFTDQVVLRPPAPGSDPPGDSPRRDAGDVIASTAIRINSGNDPLQVALRFGTRLPTPSNEVGLDRDRTDFFSTVASRYRAGPLTLSVEGGVAILGTRVDGVDQLDVLLYSGGVEFKAGPVTASGSVIGQNDVHAGVTRGNEDLSEARFGISAGDRMWVSAMTVFGLADFSPRRGLLVMVGMSR